MFKSVKIWLISALLVMSGATFAGSQVWTPPTPNPLPVAKGGTGAQSAAAALTSLGAAPAPTTAGTAEPLKAVVLNASNGVSGLGNISVGGTARTWSNASVIDIGATASIVESSTGQLQEFVNARFDGANYRYIENGVAAVYQIEKTTGRRVAYVAASGTAGTVITWVEKMVIGGSGESIFTVDSKKVRHDGNTYHGRVNLDGTAQRLPSGWSCSKISTGRYRVTHSIGSTNYTVVPGVDGYSGTFSFSVIRTGNTFDIFVFVSGSATDAPTTFTMFMD